MILYLVATQSGYYIYSVIEITIKYKNVVRLYTKPFDLFSFVIKVLILSFYGFIVKYSKLIFPAEIIY